MTDKIKVGIFIFNDVEVLDFAGPFEVFSLATKDDNNIFDVFTISENEEIISAKNDLKVKAKYTFTYNCDIDILIIPGGNGAEEFEIKNKTTLRWIIEQSKKVNILASVCTGALLLAECGILKNKKATTHWMDLDRLENDYPDIDVIRNVKYVDEGNILTSGGISAGINMSFYIIKRLFGIKTARSTAKRMEYDIII
jgi:transcriptional regulator GlxA family with amidase domain